MAKGRAKFGSVWDAIEASPSAAASLRLRAEIANAVIEEIRQRGLTQGRVATQCGVSQPRVSDLMRGRLDLFSLDALVDMASRLDLRTSVSVRRGQQHRGRPKARPSEISSGPRPAGISG